ncbi:ABC transporter ATP-binding protein [Paratractidigestivibacter faecalis]|uniref:ABC transporter ATP-binding protein n=1 Tax=Paratractidigestivibacter faecalis TaxID=2292441 RepID=A0ABV1IGE0_9ACTN
MSKQTKRPANGAAPGADMPAMQLDMATVKRLLSYMSCYRGQLALVVTCILVSAIASAASSMFLQTLIDDYIVPLLATDAPVWTGLAHALITIGAVYVVGVAATLVYNRAMVTVAQGTLKRIRDDMFSHMQTLPLRYFDTHAHGDIMSLYTNDTDTLRQMIAQSLSQLVSSVFTLVAVFVCMLWVSVGLTAVVCVLMAMVFVFVGRVTGIIGAFSIEQQDTLGALNGYIEEMVGGQKVIKVFCHEDAARTGMSKLNRAWAKAATNAQGMGNSIMPMMNALGYLIYVVVAVIGGYMAIAGTPNLGLTGFNTLTLGAIASFLTLSRNFINPVAQVSNQLNSIIIALAGAGRIFTLMDEEPESDEGYVTLVNVREGADGALVETNERTERWAWKNPHHEGGCGLVPLKGHIMLDHVSFGYVPQKLVLHDIELDAEPGQKIALVGATGAGKTTITNLINRFYDIADGKIRYDGININKIRKADLRRSLGVVLQDVNLFTGTVMDNIRYGCPDATDEQCIEAARLANADGFIRMLPAGYDTVLEGDGSGLSQGQRQLISIARAAVADPPAMILDEATSSIDARTEALVQRGMDALMEGRTTFVIAHRLSTVRNSDLICVLDHGQIIERGNHDELIAKRGYYYQLYTGAFELE